MSSAGSSPLTRGKHSDDDSMTEVPGLIPAHAGKTCPIHGADVPCRAHPRSRGENVLLSHHRKPPRRLIPAHAGKTYAAALARTWAAAHPRSRGENSLDLREVSLVPGSSPLTRGKLILPGDAEAELGLIPAHAGKTVVLRQLSGVSAAHPRSRGENASLALRGNAYWGSSPLTRGKPRHHRQNAHQRGLIPAHAGKTADITCIIASTTAHPRSRGENRRRPDKVPPAKGSSPLTRGKLNATPVYGDARGLIPAHAGKTPRAQTQTVPCRAHPRSRGENGPSRRQSCRRQGSSPLTRGKRAHAHT